MRNPVLVTRPLTLLFVATAATAVAQNDDPFDPVWAILTQDAGAASKGCRGCHVGPEPVDGISFWGDLDEATARAGIESLGLVAGACDSIFSSRLRTAQMPPFPGAPWEEGDFNVLDVWLRTYQPPPDPTLFDPVWEIMNRDAGPDSMGCRGCHVRPTEEGTGPLFGNDEETVRATLEARGLVQQGTQGSELWYRLTFGVMPMDGQSWGEAELNLLNAWLRNNYETSGPCVQ